MLTPQGSAPALGEALYRNRYLKPAQKKIDFDEFFLDSRIDGVQKLHEVFSAVLSDEKRSRPLPVQERAAFRAGQPKLPES